MRGVDADPPDLVRGPGITDLLHAPGQSFEITHEQPIHGLLVHPLSPELLAPRVDPRAEQRAALEARLLDVLLDGARRVEMKPDGTALVPLLVDADRGLLLVLPEVRDLEPAAGVDAGPGEEEEVEERPVAGRQQA